MAFLVVSASVAVIDFSPLFIFSKFLLLLLLSCFLLLLPFIKPR